MKFDVTGIGNAVVDVITHTSNKFIKESGLVRGAMTLVNKKQSDIFYNTIKKKIELPGGSAANTMTGIASLGGKGAFIGKVKKDILGKIFKKAMIRSHLFHPTPFAKSGPPTARCMIFVTPDAQRTLQTFLGASIYLTPQDIDRRVISNSRIIFLEGYLWDPPNARKALKIAAKIAKRSGVMVSLSLSDPYLVKRYRKQLLEFIKNNVDVLLANESEAKALFEIKNFRDVIPKAKKICRVSAFTRSEKGSVVVGEGFVEKIESAPVKKILDTTGAGDLYAAGFLYGLCKSYAPTHCAKLGSLVASEIISHDGAKPTIPLKHFLKFIK